MKKVTLEQKPSSPQVRGVALQTLMLHAEVAEQALQGEGKHSYATEHPCPCSRAMLDSCLAEDQHPVSPHKRTTTVSPTKNCSPPKLPSRAVFPETPSKLRLNPVGLSGLCWHWQ